MPIRLKSSTIGDARRLEADQPEVGHHHRADEDLEDEQELALLDQVGLARLVDEVGDVGHRLVNRQVLDGVVGPGAEQQPEDADDQAGEQDLVAGHAEEVTGVQVGQLDVDLAARPVRRLLRPGRLRQRAGEHDGHRHSQRRPQSPSPIRHRSSHVRHRLLSAPRVRAVTAESYTSAASPRLRSAGGSAMPPVRKIRMPSSTDSSG